MEKETEREREVEIERYEMQPDCYGGKNFDEHIPQWWGYCDGDKQDDTTRQSIVFDPKDYPPGTKIVVTSPVCPKCDEVYENCMVRGYGGPNECDFDWKKWAEGKYS